MRVVEKGNFAAAIALLLATAGFWIEGKNVSDIGGGDAFGPLFFPHMLLLIIALLALVLLAQSISFSNSADKTQASAGSWVNKDQLIFVGLFLLYLLVLPFAGYVPSTLGYLAINMVYLGKRSLNWYAIYTCCVICVTSLIYYIFAYVMKLFLP